MIIWNHLKYICNKVYYEIRNRFFAKYYRIDIREMPKGAWWDFDHKAFHVLLQMFEDFILNEKGASELSRWEYNRKKEKARTSAQQYYEELSWYERKFSKRKILKEKFAIEYLKWEIDLVNDLDTAEYERKVRRSQSESAVEQLAIWKWWTEIYKNRTDPFDTPEINEYYNNITTTPCENGNFLMNFPEKNREKINAAHVEENRREEEDTEMMVRICKVRRSLWT